MHLGVAFSLAVDQSWECRRKSSFEVRALEHVLAKSLTKQRTLSEKMNIIPSENNRF